jgi:predicted porin
MKKKLLAAAVASACAGPAFAQVPAELQIYGRVNVSVEHITIKNSSNTTALPNNSTNELVDNSSRIGFRGNKALGDGLKAFFQVESNVGLDDGGQSWSSRDSYAGLEGGFGKMRLGRTIGPVYYATYDWISMHNHDTGTSSDAFIAPTVVGESTGFMNNTIWYTSPTFGPGLSADVAYSFGATANNEARAAGLTDQPSYIGIVGNWDQGPIHLAVSYASTSNTVAITPGEGNTDTAMTIGGSYTFNSLGGFVLGALLESAESDVVGGGTAKRTYWRVAGKLPVGKSDFNLNYGTVNGRLDTNTLDDDGAKQYTIAWNYNLTKETKVYVFYTAVDNQTNGNYGFRQSTPATAGADQSSIALGFRHNF